MGSSFGQLFRITTFGESHGGGVGVVIGWRSACLTSDPRRLRREYLDNLAPQFEEEHPDFVAGYHQARQIIDRGHNNPPTDPPPGGPPVNP
jgi:hypothetical protein